MSGWTHVEPYFPQPNVVVTTPVKRSVWQPSGLQGHTHTQIIYLHSAFFRIQANIKFCLYKNGTTKLQCTWIQRSVVVRRYSSTFYLFTCLEVSSYKSFRCWRTQLWTLWRLKSETYSVVLSRVKCLRLSCFGMIFPLPCRNSWNLVKLSVGLSLYTFRWDTHIWPRVEPDFSALRWRCTATTSQVCSSSQPWICRILRSKGFVGDRPPMRWCLLCLKYRFLSAQWKQRMAELLNETLFALTCIKQSLFVPASPFAALHVIWVLRFADLGLLGTQNGNFSCKCFARFFLWDLRSLTTLFDRKECKTSSPFLHFCTLAVFEIKASSK